MHCIALGYWSTAIPFRTFASPNPPEQGRQIKGVGLSVALPPYQRLLSYSLQRKGGRLAWTAANSTDSTPRAPDFPATHADNDRQLMRGNID